MGKEWKKIMLICGGRPDLLHLSLHKSLGTVGEQMCCRFRYNIFLFLMPTKTRECT